ncbi:lactonase family protein [Endozoicomonas numazuensis]|uniref:hypothetical protein n=1 Tax=Endozoicomonas numazuensis TaxID=1137799 RepID=UPI002E811039|nr:hypothetical protein [Endozoicomonas numazuensis]
MNGALDVTLSRDGRHVYVTAFVGNALSVYDVDSDGALSNPRIYQHSNSSKLNGAMSVALSLDGQHLYVTAGKGHALSVYQVIHDTSR